MYCKTIVNFNEERGHEMNYFYKGRWKEVNNKF